MQKKNPLRKKPPVRRRKTFIERHTPFLDRFRRSEASSIVVNSLVIAFALMIVLGILTLLRPTINMMRARSLASSGRREETIQLVNRLEDEGYGAAGLEDVRHRLAWALIRQERWDEALGIIQTLSGDDVAFLTSSARYGRADQYQWEGQYAQAAQAFYQLGDFDDSAIRAKKNICALAVEAYVNGDEASARDLLLSIDDTADYLMSAAVWVTGSPEAAGAVLSNELFSPEYLNQLRDTMRALSEARESMPAGRLAAGYRHSAGLTDQGTVLAAGDNSFGQLNTSEWREVVQIAAGAYHTVGLRLDGTVLATGDNSQGQLDVEGWTDITAVAATAWGTLGLRSDGTVVSCGLPENAAQGWRGVTMIAGGGYSAACLYDQGSEMCTHSGGQLPLGVKLYDLAVCGPVAVGVTQDGSLVSSADNAPNWQSIASVSVSESYILGVTADSQVRLYTFRTGEDAAVPLDGAAKETACSGTHYLILLDDGRVAAFGDNTYGQLNVSEWRL